jgi:drug/metabolite transporter (DMT)-like permease
VGGILLALGAALGYFYPFSLSRGETFGAALVIAGVLAVAIQSVMIRRLMRGGGVSALRLTRNTMTIGSSLLLVTGLLVEGLPGLTLRGAGIMVYLAVVNTAFTFALWNHTLRVLTATEQSVIGNTMLVQIAILAWLTLGERPTPFQVGCLLVVAAATAWVQLSGGKDGGQQPVVSSQRPA